MALAEWPAPGSLDTKIMEVRLKTAMLHSANAAVKELYAKRTGSGTSNKRPDLPPASFPSAKS